MTLDGKVVSIEQLVGQKNEFFADALRNIKGFSYSRAELIHQLVFQQDDIFILRLGINRDINRETREFVSERVENWPNMLIAFNSSTSTKDGD
ncbi:MAG: hypothetical protein R2911_44885 [Caldilineaceae bacterium]